jgi:hypothetical protein
MIDGRYHLVSGYLNATIAIAKTENTQAETKPGFSVFNSELAKKKMNIISRLVRMAIIVVRMNGFI